MPESLPDVLASRYASDAITEIWSEQGRVRLERAAMARNLLMHTCAEHEGQLAEHGPQARSPWPVAAEGLIDAIVGLWQARVHVNIASR